MKPLRRLRLIPFTVAALTLEMVGCHSDGQMIFNQPRSTQARVEARKPGRRKSQVAASPVPSSRVIPPANGVDVPAIAPE